MSMLDILEDAKSGDTVPIHILRELYNSKPNIVFGFVEGTDDPVFYRGLVENILPFDWELELLPAGDKEKVLETFNSLNWSYYNDKRICFFVDRDLSEYLPEEIPFEHNIYVTDKYSIENDMVSYRTLMRILQELFNITHLSLSDRRKIEELFNTNLSLFQETMVPIMSQILIWKSCPEKIMTKNIRPKDYYVFIDGKLSLKEEYKSCCERIKHAAEKANASPSSKVEINSAIERFCSLDNYTDFIRGKYLLWFFVKFSNNLYESIPLYCANYSTRPKSKSTLGHKNAVTEIGPRVRCCTSLENFITNNFIEYINQTKANL